MQKLLKFDNFCILQEENASTKELPEEMQSSLPTIEEIEKELDQP